MRILICTGIYPPDIGGPATMIKALGNALKERGFEVRILTYANSSSCEENVFCINRKQNGFLKYLKYFVKMFRLSMWADALYVTDTYSVGYFAYLIKKITGKKYVVRFAGDSAWETATALGLTSDYITDFEEKTYSPKIEKFKKSRRKIMFNANAVIAVSNFLNELAVKIGAEKNKVITIYNSIDFEEQENGFKANLREQFGEDSKIIIYCGRLVPWKGVDTLIKIMPELLERIKNLHFVVLGDGPEQEKLKALPAVLQQLQAGQTPSIKLKDRIHFMGKIDQNKIISYFKEADVMVLNTFYEGLSHVVLEAMKAELPVIATKVGGNPETIKNGEGGILVEYNNAEQLIVAITSVLLNKEMANNFAKNSKEKLKEFNWGSTVEKTVKVLNELK